MFPVNLIIAIIIELYIYDNRAINMIIAVRNHFLQISLINKHDIFILFRESLCLKKKKTKFKLLWQNVLD